jgi:hypothetical protein
MADLDIPANDRLLGTVKRLAIKLYGDDSEVSRNHVVETALEMRIVWSDLVEKGRQETDEAVSRWAFSESPITKENTGTIRNWLFRR